jgi:hypothetical protein
MRETATTYAIVAGIAVLLFGPTFAAWAWGMSPGWGITFDGFAVIGIVLYLVAREIGEGIGE